MLVRLWAGPSCIARAISRRRSSWALMSSRATAGGIGCVARRPCRRVRVDAGQRHRCTRRRHRGSDRAIVASPRGPRPASPSARRACVSVTERGRLLEAVAGRRRSRAARRASPRRSTDGSRAGAASVLACVISRSISSSSLSSVPRSSASRADSASTVEVGGVAGSVAISPRASGSSPGASRTPRPASGR